MPGKDALSSVGRGLSWRLVHRAWRAAQQAGAITPDSPAGRRFARFGAGSIIAFPTGALYGEQWIEIGADTMIAAQVSLSAGMVPGHELGDAPVLTVGNRCVIGRGSHLVAHHSIVIGDDVFTGPNVYINDQNHGYADPEVPIGRQWPSNTAVSIGPGSWLGAGVIVLPGAQIGRNVVVAAGSVVRGQVPDRCVVAGVPAKVVREYVAGDGWCRPAPKGGAADWTVKGEGGGGRGGARNERQATREVGGFKPPGGAKQAEQAEQAEQAPMLGERT